MRRLSQPITVHTNAAGGPRVIELSGAQRPIVRVLDRWLETGRWWEGEAPRRFWRVEAGGLFDLSCDEQGQWRVEAVWD